MSLPIVTSSIVSTCIPVEGAQLTAVRAAIGVSHTDISKAFPGRIPVELEPGVFAKETIPTVPTRSVYCSKCSEPLKNSMVKVCPNEACKFDFEEANRLDDLMYEARKLNREQTHVTPGEYDHKEE